jgi:hypothetical protein
MRTVISITGRKKTDRLSTGKKVVPTHIEGSWPRALIAQSIVVGDNQPYLAAYRTRLSCWQVGRRRWRDGHVPPVLQSQRLRAFQADSPLLQSLPPTSG